MFSPPRPSHKVESPQVCQAIFKENMHLLQKDFAHSYLI